MGEMGDSGAWPDKLILLPGSAPDAGLEAFFPRPPSRIRRKFRAAEDPPPRNMQRQLLALFLLGSIYGGVAIGPCVNHDYVPCDYGFPTCIRQSQVCDGKKDCENGSDEDTHKCAEYCQPPLVKCKPDGICIHMSLVCDGTPDCNDGADELGCDSSTISFATACTENEFQCLDRFHCIPLDEYCDGRPDCIDGSDEFENCHYNKTCTGFKCENGRCIIEGWKCDGTNDCGDNSDELHCDAKPIEAANCTNAIGKYLCRNKRCINLDLTCNSVNDCGDESDEDFAQCAKAKAMCANSTHTCTQKCFPTPRGYQCSCSPGYTLKSNGVCEDIDECMSFPCEQECRNTVGSYYCQCADGYERKDNGHCKAQNGEALMVFASKSSIRGYYLESGVYYSIANGLEHVVGVSLDPLYVYWSDIQLGDEAIFRSLLDDGETREVIANAGLGCPEDIAVDWVTGNVYFTDSMFMHIGVCSQQDSVQTFCTVIIKENTEKPRGIALLPSKKRLYWSDWGQNPHISVADMDGQNREFFIKENIGWPNGLTIDYASQRLYWVDAKLKVIESILLDGRDRRTVLHDVAKHPYSIAIFENKLYWSDWSTNSIHSCDKMTGKNYTTLFQKNETVYGIHIYHSTLKVKHSTPCVAHPCSHLCLLAPKTEYTCACPLDMELTDDKHTCMESVKRKHMAIAAGNTIIDYYHELLGKPKTSKNGISSEHISALTYDSISDSIIVADEIKRSIFRYNPHKGTVNHMIPIVNEYIESMAFDHFGNNLYKSVALHRKIEVHSLTTGEKTEFSYTESPYNLVVIPEEGIMFVVFRTNGGINGEFHIDKAQMNGLGSRSHVVEHGLVGPTISLAYDVDARRVYWADEGTGRIENIDTQGQNRILLRSAVSAPVSLAVLDNDVFWTSRKSNRLSWTDKTQSFSGTKGLNLRLTNHPTVIHLQTITGVYNGEVHPCRKNNGDCSHICLVSDSSKKLCACPPDYAINSDQKTCRPKTSCYDDEIKCNSTDKCIKKFQRCDGLDDCANGEDEKFCSTVSTACHHDEFPCRNGQCIKKSERCDSVFHCQDRSDEENCENATCAIDLFRCQNGNCVSVYVLCNGADDCGDFSDEDSCSGHGCDDHSFQCSSGLCIPQNWECDGQVDCNDGSDEHSKCKPTECGQNMFSCKNGHCVDVLLRCNGIDDCNDNSDEHSCPMSTKFEALICTKDQYRCRNSTICISNKLKCDGNLDCPKHDDELGCGKCLPDTQFTCRNGNCVPIEWTCDQADDCGDNSDELHCDELRHLVPFTEEPPHNCSEGQHPCKTGFCLDLDKFCDGKSHCLDASDEGGQCETACAENTCENICHKTPSGPVCSCREGYKLSADSKSCEDIDECKTQACPQMCLNRPGSYSCFCYDGYALRLNRVSCKAVGPAVKIFTATEDDIRMMSPSSLDSSLTIINHDPGNEITGLDTNARDNTIYWSSATRGEISKMNIDTKQSTIASSGIIRPEILAVDWITDNVYYFDNRRAPVIKACDIDANKCSKIVHIEGSNTKVTAIAIEARGEILFWSQVNWKLYEKPTSEIMRSDLIGGDSKKLVHENLGIVSGLTIDHHRQILYWADNFEANIECVDFNGENRKSILEDLISKPIGLHFYEDSLYWKTESSGVLRKRQLYGDMTYTLIPIGSNNIKKLFVVSQISRQPEGVNKCKDHGCEHMCIIHKMEPLCVCSNGFPATLRDGRGCSDDSHDEGVLFDENSTHIRLHGDEAAPTVVQARKSTGSRGTGAITGLAVTLVTFALLFSVYFYLKKKKPGLFKGRVLSIHFQNPSFARRRNNNSSMTSSTSILMPGEHEYSNPITEMSNTKTNLPDSTSKRRLEVMTEVSDGETEETNPAYNSRLIR